MNVLIKKEVRLLLPVWAAAIVLALAMGRIGGPGSSAAYYPVFFGMTLLGVASYGREFALGTSTLLFAQPVRRSRLWQIKALVLATALLSVACAYFASRMSAGAAALSKADLGLLLLSAPMALAGGFCTALLVRQIIPAVGMTFLLPFSISLPVLLFLDQFQASARSGAIALFTVLAIYSLSALAYSWRLFRNAQDVPGDLLTVDHRIVSHRALSRFPSRAPHAPQTTRPHRKSPWRALFLKEFRLHKITLLGMAGLFLLHLCVLAIRRIPHDTHTSLWQSLDFVLPLFGAVWLLPPFLIGAACVAEERKLGILGAQLCLPVSSRAQLLIKYLVALLCGGILTVLLLCSAEFLGHAVSLRSGGPLVLTQNGNVSSMLSQAQLNQDVSADHFTELTLLACAITTLVVFASTLSANILEALSAGILFFLLANAVCGLGAFRRFELFGFKLYSGSLLVLVSFAASAATLAWLGQRNFRQVRGGGHLWRSNIFAVAAVAMSVPVLATLVYHRTWQILAPALPAHGAARIPPDQTVSLKWRSGALLSLLPDGRLWVARLMRTSDGIRLGGHELVAGSDWIDATLTSRTVVGIQRDGSLWFAEPKQYVFDDDLVPAAELGKPVVMHRFKSESKWRGVAQDDKYPLLLGSDGSLWRWGPSDPKIREAIEKNSTLRGDWGWSSWGWYSRAKDRRTPDNWPGLNAFPPHRLGIDTDWTRFLPYQQWYRTCIGKRDGSAWLLTENISLYHTIYGPYQNGKAPKRRGGTQGWWDGVVDLTSGQEFATDLWAYKCSPVGGVAPTRWSSFQRGDRFEIAIRDDGTLWAWGEVPAALANPSSPKNSLIPIQLGGDSNWRWIMEFGDALLAMKSDGELWECDLRSTSNKHSWTRMDRNHDWLSVCRVPYGLISLAADGGLWFWPNTGTDLLTPSKRPKLLCNIFADSTGGNKP